MAKMTRIKPHKDFVRIDIGSVKEDIRGKNRLENILLLANGSKMAPMK